MILLNFWKTIWMQKTWMKLYQVHWKNSFPTVLKNQTYLCMAVFHLYTMRTHVYDALGLCKDPLWYDRDPHRTEWQTPVKTLPFLVQQTWPVKTGVSINLEYISLKNGITNYIMYVQWWMGREHALGSSEFQKYTRYCRAVLSLFWKFNEVLNKIWAFNAHLSL